MAEQIGRVYMIDTSAVEADHPVEWLRGKRLIGIAVDELPTKRIGDVVTVTVEEGTDG